MTDPACKLTHLALGAAGSRMSVAAGLELDHRRWGWSPKIDGAFVYLTTDHRGRVATMLHRSGRPVTQLEADGLYGQPIGLPDSAITGELECHTEAGLRARQARGWAALHVFDCARYAGRSIAALPATDRHHRLQRWQALTECYEPEVGRHDWWTDDARGNAHDEAGRFTVARPRDLRRLPLVPIARGPAAAELLWQEYVVRGGGEGLVAVRLAAPMGARGSKRKIKLVDDLDVTVVSVGNRAASVSWRGHTFAMSAIGRTIQVGEVWTIKSDGFYETGVTPRFPRWVRRRDDIAAGVAT